MLPCETLYHPITFLSSEYPCTERVKGERRGESLIVRDTGLGDLNMVI